MVCDVFRLSSIGHHDCVPVKGAVKGAVVIVVILVVVSIYAHYLEFAFVALH